MISSEETSTAKSTTYSSQSSQMILIPQMKVNLLETVPKMELAMMRSIIILFKNYSSSIFISRIESMNWTLIYTHWERNFSSRLIKPWLMTKNFKWRLKWLLIENFKECSNNLMTNLMERQVISGLSWLILIKRLTSYTSRILTLKCHNLPQLMKMIRRNKIQ